MPTTDLLMITHRRATYAAQALERLLACADGNVRVWLWQNGSDARMLEVWDRFRRHPRVHRSHHSPENERLLAPTNWLWENAEGDYVGKVDDDCLVQAGWTDTLMAAHESWDGFGVLGCWRFQEEDFDPEVASRKIQSFPGGHRVLRNLWVQGSSYLLPTRHVRRFGLLEEQVPFTRYCKKLALEGYVNGWYFPFVYEDHMDDPRSPNSGLRTDEDLLDCLPLSARQNGVRTLGEWEASIRRSARIAQEASIDPRRYRGLRRRVRNVSRRVKRGVTGRHW